MSDPSSERAYRRICASFGITPPRIKRAYWLLSATEGSVSAPSAPDEVSAVASLLEGAARSIELDVFERDARARHLCIEHYGAACVVCGMSFGNVYGPELESFIHVHHLRPLSEIRAEYRVDPIRDLRPVCPNCHAVLHSESPPIEIDVLRAKLHGRGPG